MRKMIEVEIKITAPPGAPPGEEEKLAGMLLKLAETIAEITGSPKPVMRRIEHEQDNQGRE